MFFEGNKFSENFPKGSVVKFLYNRSAVCTLQVCSFTQINSLLDVFLRIFKALAINYSS